MAAIVLSSVQNDISKTSYTLSRYVKKSQNILRSRALLDRVAANNSFINAIVIMDNSNVLLSTDPKYQHFKLPQSNYVEDLKPYDQLMHTNVLDGTIRFYTGDGKLQTLHLFFILDKDELDIYFSENRGDFILYFGFFPLLLILGVYVLFKKHVVNPLERLRQFAYYQSEIPKKFKLKELESIRYSMVQTFARLDAEKKELYRMARTDSLSGLANRDSLNEYLHRLIADSARNNKEFALLFLDLDHFKTVNDSLGHNVGDELLQNIASIIQDVLRATDFVARVGGDEFVVVVNQYSSLVELTQIIQRIQEQLSRQWVIQTHPMYIDSSVGIAIYPKDGTDMISLMKHADIAMYDAKKNGRAQYRFFTTELNKSVQDTISLDKEMREALKNGHYELYYQPKIDIHSQKIIGAEALIRWIDPLQGMIPPDIFIPLAEENGFILELGEWVLRENIRQYKAWQNEGIDIKLSVNISTRQLLEASFGKKVLSLIKENEMDPAKLDIEITEYIFMDQKNTKCDVLDILHDQGVSISLDDFGTGYSSLSYLKKFPIDCLKIDKSFIDDYHTQDGAIFIETIVKMGQTLNMEVIAEGVESVEQVEYLKSIGCHQYQGYYYSKPLNTDDFKKLFKASL